MSNHMNVVKKLYELASARNTYVCELIETINGAIESDNYICMNSAKRLYENYLGSGPQQ